ncbi:hypothetical protein A3C37_03970 [Candidatus Peribacteria bacterium RIFCSPHIGHO2_02_FULL_53_20]|nr:MAG: hypothetical protein A3C37_03970 [Candidatus Peribacteria bacterium RIFCSPHIGHO2_02_FULL_53_20]OGJ65676.1 MAG: hypothetical protein A3B61_00025 [Candidatus Peribacteria bacterium RIFCSPLOWO2_01_FULL_53_10]OGJ72532.1 MAG: hypothetical protein A3G69_02340 [Candidatus Peribacteria bacterium RIFCSPLOWO2_12_FULL_53_10]
MPKILVSTGILALMVALGIADAFLIEGGLPKEVLPDEPYASDTPQSFDNAQDKPPQPAQTSSISSDSTNSSSSPAGIRKATGPDVLLTLTRLGFEIETSDELTILRTVIPSQEAEVSTYVLLLNGDRAGLIAWTESPQVKNYFLALKEALHASFSPRVKDLLDETQRLPGKPPRNFLTFLDEGLSPERLVFLRVRERLYEIRIAEGRDAEMFALIEELTQ